MVTAGAPPVWAIAAGIASLSDEMSAAWTSMRSTPVALPGFIISKVPAFSCQS